MSPRPYSYLRTMAIRTRPRAAPRHRRTGGVIHRGQVATLNGVKVIADGNGKWRRFNPLANSTTSGEVVGTYSNTGRSDSRPKATSITSTSLRSGGSRNRASTSSGRRGAATTSASRSSASTRSASASQSRPTSSAKPTKGSTRIRHNVREVYDGTKWVKSGRPRTQTERGNQLRTGVNPESTGRNYPPGQRVRDEVHQARSSSSSSSSRSSASSSPSSSRSSSSRSSNSSSSSSSVSSSRSTPQSSTPAVSRSTPAPLTFGVRDGNNAAGRTDRLEAALREARGVHGRSSSSSSSAARSDAPSSSNSSNGGSRASRWIEDNYDTTPRSQSSSSNPTPAPSSQEELSRAARWLNDNLNTPAQRRRTQQVANQPRNAGAGNGAPRPAEVQPSNKMFRPGDTLADNTKRQGRSLKDALRKFRRRYY